MGVYLVRYIAVVLVAAAVVLLAATWRLGLTTEGAQLQYVALQILNGRVPYRDLFEINMPVTYLFGMTVIEVFGKSDLGWRTFDYFALILIVVPLCLCFPRGKRDAACIAGALFAIYHVVGSGASGLGQRDFLMLIPLAWFTLCYCLGVPSLRRQNSLLFVGVAGGLLGLAAFVKPTALVLFPIFAVHLVILAKRVRGSVYSSASLLGGGLFTAVGIFSWLGIAGGLHAFIDIQLNFVLPIYSRYHYPFSWQGNRVLIFLSAIGVLSAVSCMLHFRERGHDAYAPGEIRSQSRGTVFCIMTAFGLVHYIAQWKFSSYHWNVLIAYSLFTTATAFNLSRASTVPAIRSLGSVLVVGALLGTLGLFYTSRLTLPQLFSVKRSDLVLSLEHDLAAMGAAGRVVQPIDDTAGVLETLYRTNRPLPTRYVYGFPFFLPDQSRYLSVLRSDFLSALAERGYPPIVIANVQFPYGATYDTLRQWPDFVKFLNEHYSLAIDRFFPQSGKGYRIYVPRR